MENLDVVIKDHGLSDAWLEHINDELVEDHDKQKELENCQESKDPWQYW